MIINYFQESIISANGHIIQWWPSFQSPKIHSIVIFTSNPFTNCNPCYPCYSFPNHQVHDCSFLDICVHFHWIWPQLFCLWQLLFLTVQYLIIFCINPWLSFPRAAHHTIFQYPSILISLAIPCSIIPSLTIQLSVNIISIDCHGKLGVKEAMVQRQKSKNKDNAIERVKGVRRRPLKVHRNEPENKLSDGERLQRALYIINNKLELNKIGVTWSS